MSEDFRSHLSRCTTLFLARDIKFTSKNDGQHLIVENPINAMPIDFWPATGKFFDRSQRRYDRGIGKLLKVLGK